MDNTPSEPDIAKIAAGTTNEAALKLAREVIAKMEPNFVFAEQYRKGERDGDICIKIALAAILEVTERAAKREDALAADADAEWQSRQRHDPEDEGSNYLWLRNRHRQGAFALRNMEHLS